MVTMKPMSDRPVACTAAAALAIFAVLQPPAASAEDGLASWYGQPFHGQIAASGEPYDAAGFTAAHRTLPFGTAVRVRRVDSGETVVVRVTDRGPYCRNRIIDLSEAAAKRLGMTAPGVVPVALEVVDDEDVYAV